MIVPQYSNMEKDSKKANPENIFKELRRLPQFQQNRTMQANIPGVTRDTLVEVEELEASYAIKIAKAHAMMKAPQIKQWEYTKTIRGLKGTNRVLEDSLKLEDETALVQTFRLPFNKTWRLQYQE
jgi:hypothetical protein